MMSTVRLYKFSLLMTAYGAVLALTCQIAEAEVRPFTITGGGIVDFVPFVPFDPGGSNENSQAFHFATGEATELGTYYGEGTVRLDAFTSASTAAFSSAVPFVFTAEDGDKLAFTYGDTTNGAAAPGEVALSDGGNGKFIATWTAEFNPVLAESTGRFADVIGGSFIMVAVTEPFVFGIKPVGGVAYTWDGTGTLAFVPEPSSIALLIVGAVGGLGLCWRRKKVRALHLALPALFLAATATQAAPIVAGSATQPYVNIQQIRLFPGTPFNPGTEPVEFELIAQGLLTAAWDAQVGNTMQHTVPFVDFQGVFPGGIPFHILAGTPNLPPTTGQFSSIVQNTADPGFAAGAPSSLISADYMNTAYFKQVLPDGTTIYSDQVNPAVFTSTLAGLPYPVGQEFVSTGALNLYLQLGGTIDQAHDLLIGQSLHRTVTVVPEPTTLTLLSLGAVCFYAGLWRRSRA